jgi:hypothetical protein
VEAKKKKFETKSGLISIVDGDGGGGIEKEVIHFIARVIRADTRFSGIHSRDNHRSRRGYAKFVKV